MKSKLMARLQRYLFTGFVAVVPMVLTVSILWALFSFIDRILGRFVNVFLIHTLGFSIPGLGFLLFFILIITVGFLTSHFFGRSIFHRLERWFAGLPLINKIYPTFKQIVQFITAQKEFGFRRVVLVEYPAKGIWSLAFMTHDQVRLVSDMTGREMAAVLIPTVPNPLTGFVIFVPKDEIRMTDLPVAEALKIIMSGGVYWP